MPDQFGAYGGLRDRPLLLGGGGNHPDPVPLPITRASPKSRPFFVPPMVNASHAAA